MAKMPLEQKYQNNDLGDQEDVFILRPELPPRAAATTVQRSSPHVSNQNVFAVLVKNRRQITSLTAGMRSQICFCFLFLFCIISNFLLFSIFIFFSFFCDILLIVDNGINKYY